MKTLGLDAIYKIINEFEFDTVLDIGCGNGSHTKIFRDLGKIVTPTDYCKKFDGVIEGLYENLEFKEHDVTWVCHVLEHQLNPHNFLRKVWCDTKINGHICVTVPPLKHNIVGGHVSLWNAGLLMYHMVLAGFNCKNAKIKKYGYNISVIAKKEIFIIPKLNYDIGDIELLNLWLPDFCRQGFDGNIEEYNW